MSRDQPDDEFPPYYFGPPETQPPHPAQQQPMPPPTGPAQPPPGYPPYPVYGAGPAFAPYPWNDVPDVAGTPSRLRGHRVWATLAQVTILGDVLLHLLVYHNLSAQRDQVHRVNDDPFSVSQDQATAAYHATRNSAYLLIALLVVGGIFLMVWLFRLRTDAGVFTPRQLTLSRGWAIGGWFIPLANLVLPLIVFRDVVNSMRRGPDGQIRTGAGWMWLVAIWWLAWVVGGVGSRLVNFNTDTVSAIDSAVHKLGLLLGVEGVAGLLAIAVIEVLTRANKRRWAAQTPRAIASAG